MNQYGKIEVIDRGAGEGSTHSPKTLFTLVATPETTSFWRQGAVRV